jgi:adenosylhomocysteine nucleosidase
MDEELAILQEKLNLEPLETRYPWPMWENRDLNLLATVCGVGKVNAAACLSQVLSTYAVERIIGVGVAGGIGEGLRIGDVVVCRDAIQHDFDLQIFNYERGTIPRLRIREFPADDEMVKKALNCAGNNGGISVREGRVLSGDRFVTGSEGRELHTVFTADCVDMETAAWAHVAYLYKVPWVAIRSISDNADEEATVDFPVFLQMAVGRMSEVVERMVQSYQ